MSYTSSTGDRKGVEPRDKTRGKKASQADPVALAVHDRAFELIRAVWLAERWKSSITTKLPSYLHTLLFGRKLTPPVGVPVRLVRIVQRCVAQACLETGATGLNVQHADWYPAAEAAAREKMQ